MPYKKRGRPFCKSVEKLKSEVESKLICVLP